MGQHRQPSLAADALHRLREFPGADGLPDEQPQQVPVLGGHLHAGDQQEIREFRHLLQGPVVVADGRAVQSGGSGPRRDLRQSHAAVRRALRVDMQIQSQLHGHLRSRLFLRYRRMGAGSSRQERASFARKKSAAPWKKGPGLPWRR